MNDWRFKTRVTELSVLRLRPLERRKCLAAVLKRKSIHWHLMDALLTQIPDRFVGNNFYS